jgi:spermidine/putrescine transport system substrate-binding protein
MIDDLVRQEFHVALGYSGDVGQAHGSLEDVQYVIPREGGYVWADNLCIPKDAPHYEAAIRFINYVLRPEVAASITDTVGYPNAVAKARAQVRPELLDNPLGYAPESMLEHTIFQQDLGPGERLWDRVWEKVKLQDA